MRENVKNLCDLFMENKRRIGKSFAWENSHMPFVAAAELTVKGAMADVEKMKECEGILKKNTGAFSELKGFAKLPLLVKMIYKEDPADFIAKVQKVEKSLKKPISDANYRLLTAISLVEFADESQYEEMVETTKLIYNDMKSHHKFLTASDDMPAAALLALSGRPVEVISEDMEACFNILKTKFKRSNGTQSVSQVLALSTMDITVKCQRLIDIYDALKAAKCGIGSGYREFSILACLAATEISVDELVQEIVEADLYIKSQKGFGSFSLDTTKRRLYAALMVLTALSDGATVSGAVSNAVAAEIAAAIAEEVAVICSIMACSTAAATAAAHN